MIHFEVNWRRLGALLGLVGLALVPAGCSEPTAPTDVPRGETQVEFDGLWNDDGGEFLLQRIDDSNGRPFAVDLVGADLEVSPTDEIVAISVALRNRSNLTLYVPAMVRLHHFVPGTVTPLEGDLQILPVDSTTTGAVLREAFADYSDSFGDDGALGPGEDSDFLRWRFHVPGLSAFAFAVELSVALEPRTATISGHVFTDQDRDGRFDPNEPPFFGQVSVLRPDGSRRLVTVGEDGAYAVPVKDAGLHEVTYVPPPTLQFAPLCLTTPNPLQVLLPPGPDGAPRSFEGADFGIDPEPCLPGVPFVQLTDAAPGDIESDFHRLSSVDRVGDNRVVLHVGFSGCDADHDFALFAGENFAESEPPQTWAVLQHDDLGQLCDAYFERDLVFDLTPLRARYRELYGNDGSFKVRFLTQHGAIHEILMD